MKKTSRLLIGAALVTAVIGFAGCAMLGEDTGKAIKGTGSHRTVDYTNTDAENVYRGFKDTGMKHLGGKFTITMDKDSHGVMGIIFDLKKNKNDKKAKDFYIVGISTTKKLKPSATGKQLTPYVSKYSNVTKVQEVNFGAPTGTYAELPDNPAVEVEISALAANNTIANPEEYADDSGNYVFCVKIYPTDSNGARLEYSSTLKLHKPGETKKYEGGIGYKIELYKKDFSGTPITYTIPATGTKGTGYTDETIEQAKLAYYVNVYEDSTVTGEWKAGDFIALAEVIEYVED